MTCPNPPVRVAAATQSHLRDGEEMFDYYVGDRATFPEAAWMGRQLYEATGLTPDDIDVAMIYENFTPTVFLQLEAFGFCGPGEATDFIAGGNIEVGGKIPVNPNGGLLGRGLHPRDEQHPRRACARFGAPRPTRSTTPSTCSCRRGEVVWSSPPDPRRLVA